MNKLSDLIYLRDQLLALDASELDRVARLTRTNFTPIDFLTFDKDAVALEFDNFVSTVDALRDKIANTITKIDEEIAVLREEYLIESKKEEEFHLRASVQDNRELRNMFMHPVSKEEVAGRIGVHTDWRYPGLEIGPGDGDWTPYLVAQDPLYLVDIHEEFLTGTKLKFTEEYQARLRTYVMRHGDFSMLPQEQFGFVFCWNLFNYFSLDTIELYLKRIMPLLKPGGVVMFSYNNGERYKSVELFENHFMTYAPKRDIEKIVLELGYEIITSRDIDTHVSWFEVKRPGELESLRAGQTLAKIIDQ